ncbi:hypothetical protein, partial [Brevibacillus sp. SIMBA_040]|uniref:hypothetical protein n=1 Tax=Brevibacillus sp. SIMBA_040 TaxID=3085781 RepID=UPI00397A2D1C
ESAWSMPIRAITVDGGSLNTAGRYKLLVCFGMRLKDPAIVRFNAMRIVAEPENDFVSAVELHAFDACPLNGPRRF